MIGDEVEITIVDVRGDKVRLGINAPRTIQVHRKEVYEAIRRENTEAANVRIDDLNGLSRRVPPRAKRGLRRGRSSRPLHQQRLKPGVGAGTHRTELPSTLNPPERLPVKTRMYGPVRPRRPRPDNQGGLSMSRINTNVPGPDRPEQTCSGPTRTSRPACSG